MHYFAEYGLFLAKIITVVLAIFVIVVGIFAIGSKGKEKIKERLVIKKLNDKYRDMKNSLSHYILSKQEFKQLLKTEKKTEKIQKEKPSDRKKIYLLHFNGDLKASTVKNLREEITTVLMVATPKDEVVLCLESPGGMVHSYGLAASQLTRIRQRQIPLTVIVDKIAASGGYLMASVANRIIAAPFAVVGSIGVLAQLPNFHRFLEKHNIDFEQMTAGEYKRTLTMFGKNTEKGRKKFQEEIEEVHKLFKQFIVEYRPKVDINKVATGEHWYGSDAMALNLVDELMTSDDYLLNASVTADIYKVSYLTKKTLADKISMTAQAAIDKTVQAWPLIAASNSKSQNINKVIF